MPGVQTVWGIDVGRSALKAIRLRLVGEGQVEIAGHDFVEHAKILSQPDADRDELIANSLEKFLSRNDITNDSVVIGVPGQQTLARFTKLPPVDAKRVPDIVRYEADQQIPFDLDEVIWDYQLFMREGLPDVEVGIFAMKRELIRGHLLPFEQAGIEPVIVQAGPLAIYNAALFEGLVDEETTLLLDIGAESTDLLLATTSSLWTRTIPLGGNRFTEALVKSFKLSFSKAENLKRTAASSRYARQIFQAMRPIFADLVQELQRSIGFYAATHRDARVSKVVGFGNAFRLPGLAKYLQQNLGYPVEQPSTFKKAAGLSTPAAAPLGENAPGFAVSYGLALQGLAQTPVTANLLPTEIAKQAAWRKKRPFMAAAAACLVLAGGLVWLRYTWDMSALASGQGQSPPPPSSPEQAGLIIEEGPPPGLSLREEAQTIQLAATELQRTYSDLQGQGEGDIEAARTLIDLQQKKAIFPRILAAIHQALPGADDPIASAASVEEYVRLVREGQIPPREQRKSISIREIKVNYVNDIQYVRFPNPKETKPQVDYGEDKIPGFFIEIYCTTAHQDRDDFVEREFLARLRKLGFTPGTGFIFNRVYLGERNAVTPVKASPGSTGAGAAGQPEKDPLRGEHPPQVGFVDILTGEARDGEWEYRIFMDAIIEDAGQYLETEGEEGEGEQEASEGAAEGEDDGG